jgi:hypothetical protein
MFGMVMFGAIIFWMIIFEAIIRSGAIVLINTQVLRV